MTSLKYKRFRNVQVYKDKSKIYFKISFNSPKILIKLKDISSVPVFLYIVREKKTSINSLMVRYIFDKVVLAFFKKFSKKLLGIGIFLARNGLISMKNSRKCLVILVSSVMGFLPTTSFEEVFICYADALYVLFLLWHFLFRIIFIW